MANNDLATFLEDKKCSKYLQTLLDAEILSVDMLAASTQEDLIGLGIKPIPAKALVNLANGAGRKDQRKGNFGNGGAYSEHGTAIGSTTTHHTQINGNSNSV